MIGKSHHTKKTQNRLTAVEINGALQSIKNYHCYYLLGLLGHDASEKKKQKTKKIFSQRVVGLMVIFIPWESPNPLNKSHQPNQTNPSLGSPRPPPQDAQSSQGQRHHILSSGGSTLDPGDFVSTRRASYQLPVELWGPLYMAVSPISVELWALISKWFFGGSTLYSSFVYHFPTGFVRWVHR